MARWLNRMTASPGVGLLVQSLRQRWHRHPARTAVVLALAAVKTQIQPLARDHPVAFVLGAGAAGMLLAASRPWRWALRPVLLAGLLPRVLKTVLRQGLNPPPASRPNPWVDVLTVLLNASSPPAPPQRRSQSKPVTTSKPTSAPVVP